MSTRTPATWSDRARLRAVWAYRELARLRALPRAPRAAVAAVFPSLAGLAAVRVAADVAAHVHAMKAVDAARRRWGDAWLARVIEVRGGAVLDRLRAERRPIVVVTWHAGLVTAIPAGLADVGLGGVILSADARAPEHGGFRVLAVGADSEKRALVLVHAIGALRRGECALFVIGPHAGPSEHGTTPLLGRAVALRAGVLALPRLAGAALVPIEGRLARDRIVVDVRTPIAVGPTDRDTMQALAAHYEARLARDPGSLWSDSLAHLASAPHA